MAQSKKERCEAILRELKDGNEEIEGVALFTAEGQLLAHSLSNGFRPEQIVATAAPMLEFGKAAAVLQNGAFEELQIQGAQHAMLLYEASVNVLAIMVKRSANLGMINFEVRSARENLNQVFG